MEKVKKQMTYLRVKREVLVELEGAGVILVVLTKLLTLHNTGTSNVSALVSNLPQNNTQIIHT